MLSPILQIINSMSDWWFPSCKFGRVDFGISEIVEEAFVTF